MRSVGNISRLTWKLFALGILVTALWFVTSPRTATAVGDCLVCDTNFGTCRNQCYTNYDQCIINNPESYCASIRNECIYVNCAGTYQDCLQNCTAPPPSGGGGSTCGRQRTQCELSCQQGRAQCVNEGGDNCGQQYLDCVAGCCP